MEKQKKAAVLCLLFSLMFIFIFNLSEISAKESQKKCSRISVKICKNVKKSKVLCKKKIKKKYFNCLKNVKKRARYLKVRNKKKWEKELYYLETLLTEAKKDLKRSKVSSRAASGKLVADVIPSKIVVAISINENIDRKLFKQSKSLKSKIIKKTMYEIGSKYDIYSRRVSSDGAKGLFQQISSSYNVISKRYPDARLKKNFNKGMRNERNAAKASILHLDNDLEFLLKKFKKKFSKSDIKIMRRYLVASYNCGAHRVKNAVLNHGSNWEKHLPLETRIYLKNFDEIWKVI